MGFGGQSSLVSQAAILCGGLGTRLRPYTELVPKPMVEVAGRPFLEHLLDQISEEGVRRFVLMTGYMGDQIRSYFGDGSEWGWEITYCHGPIDWETGRRLVEASDDLDPSFLLLYSDNWADLDLLALESSHRSGGGAVTVTLVGRDGGNVLFEGGPLVEAYVPSRTGERLDHVEIGYAIIEKALVIESLEAVEGSPDIGFDVVLESLAATGDLGGHLLGGSYRSISDPERLKVTREFFDDRRVLLIDRDGTINRKAAPGEYVATWSEFVFIPETVEAMRILAGDGFEFVVITNQAGIALGVVDAQDVDRIHERMSEALSDIGVEVRGIYLSPDHWEVGSSSRKPAPGMFYAASEDHRFRLDRVLYVGDDVRDCEAAVNAGCGMVFLDDGDGHGDLPINRRHCSVHRSLLDAVEQIRDYYGVEGD